jgi:hypothetical protein
MHRAEELPDLEMDNLNPSRPPSLSSLEQYIDATAQILQLSVDPAHRPGVVNNMAQTAAIAQLVLDFPLPDDLEPASTFTP